MAVIRRGREARIAGYGVYRGHLRYLHGCHHVGNVFDLVEEVIVATVPVWSGDAQLIWLE